MSVLLFCLFVRWLTSALVLDKEMSEKPPSPEWPPEVSEEEKAQFLLSQAQQQKKRFGNLKAREKLPPHVSERDVVNRKLREGRAFFDSADYFRALQLGKNQVSGRETTKSQFLLFFFFLIHIEGSCKYCTFLYLLLSS